MAGYKDDVILRTKYELMALTARDLVDREYVVRAMRAALMGPLFEVASVNGAIARAADRCTSELNEILDEVGRREHAIHIEPPEPSLFSGECMVRKGPIGTCPETATAKDGAK